MTQIVYISGHLEKATEKGIHYGTSVANELQRIEGIEIKTIENHSNNVWCRDYMPVISASGVYVQFTYCPSYMKGMKKYAGMFPDVPSICKVLGVKYKTSDIVLDGGAIEIHGKKGIVSDRVFSDNNIPAEEIYNELKTILELDQLIVIPQYPYDFTGHVDGLVRFINQDSVVVNDLEKELEIAEKSKIPYRIKRIRRWVADFKTALTNAGLKIEELPVSYPENGTDSSGEGVYVNFLLLDNLIVMPAYENKTDNETAANKLTQLYGKTVVQVHATELSKMGGMINCVTWSK